MRPSPTGATTFGLFGKHVQDEIATEEDAGWLLELLVTIFGSKEAVRRDHPFSVLFCPVSPLAMEAEHTDAWLATAGWDIPIAIMPMPMMGTSAPTGLRSTIVAGNAEVLGTICLAQAAHEGTPVIYAPALAAMEPRTGRWGGGGPEHSLLGAATTEMARFYGLPVTASNGGTDHFVDGRPGGLRADPELGAAGPVVAGHHDRPGVAGRRVDAVPRADGDRRRGVPDVPAAPRGDRRRGRRDGRRRGARRGRTARRLPGPDRRPATPSGAASGSCRGSGTTRPSTAGRRRGGRTSSGEAREKAFAAIAAHEPLPFADEVDAELARLEQAARSGATAPARG